MTLTNIQNTTFNCCAMASGKAAAAAEWLGHNVHALGQFSVKAGYAACNGIEFAATKCAAFVKALLSGACMYGNMGWQVAKYLGARSWECAKICGTATLEKASVIFSMTVNGIGVGANAVKCGALKVGAFSLQKIVQFGNFAKDVGTAAGQGALQGLEISRNFVVTHPKEILLVGGALTIGLAVGFAAAHVLNPPQELA